MARPFVLPIALAALSAAACSSTSTEDDSANDALAWIDDGCDGSASASQRCDQGLYWFGKDNASEKWRPKAANPFFDTKKPTILYVHGWQPGTVAGKVRETFNYKTNDPEAGADIVTSNAWLKAGWNVGIFYWDRLADDPGVGLFDNPQAAEAKIAQVDGPTAMRWRKNDGSYETADVPRVPAADLFYQTYVAAMRDYVGPNVRIAGHSLGNQMAVRMIEKVSNAVAKNAVPRALMPKRLAMLDPFWTKQKTSSGSRAGAARDVRDAVYLLARNGLAIEQYRSSSINDLGLGDHNPFVEENAAYVELDPNWGSAASYLPWKFLRSDHRAAPNLYFWSLAFPPPSSCDGTKAVGLSASATDATVRQWMGPARYWVQGGGNRTATPADDCFVERRDNLPATVPIAMTWTRRDEPGTLEARVEVPAHTATVRYFVAGHRVALENRIEPDDKFEVILRGLPQNATAQLIVASAFDHNDKLIGTAENMVDLTPDVGMSIRQLGRMTFEVSAEGAPPALTTIEVDVDGAVVTDSVTNKPRTERKAVLATYPVKDGEARSFVLRGYDAANAPLFTLERSFVLR